MHNVGCVVSWSSRFIVFLGYGGPGVRGIHRSWQTVLTEGSRVVNTCVKQHCTNFCVWMFFSHVPDPRTEVHGLNTPNPLHHKKSRMSKSRTKSPSVPRKTRNNGYRDGKTNVGVTDTDICSSSHMTSQHAAERNIVGHSTFTQ